MSGTVLIVEDDEAIQEVLGLALEGEGYDVVASRDGVEALEQLVDRRPALIVLDWRMPRMGGERFAEELRGRGLRPGVPILVLTADVRAAATARIAAEGCLLKPYDLDDLLDEVARLVRPAPTSHPA